MKSNVFMRKSGTETEAFLLRPKSDLVRRYREAAEEFGYDSGNEVGVEVLSFYLDFWIEVKRAEREALAQQKEQVLGKLDAAQTQPERRKNTR